MLKKIAEYYKALADENRLKIVQMLSEKDMCVCEIIEQLDMSQPAISHHLKILRQAGIVKDTKEGKWIYYSIERDTINDFDIQFKTIISNTNDQDQKGERTDCSVCERLEKQKKVLKEVR